jgi:hypothetical protein
MSIPILMVVCFIGISNSVDGYPGVTPIEISKTLINTLDILFFWIRLEKREQELE